MEVKENAHSAWWNGVQRTSIRAGSQYAAVHDSSKLRRRKCDDNLSVPVDGLTLRRPPQATFGFRSGQLKIEETGNRLKSEGVDGRKCALVEAMYMIMNPFWD